MDGMARATTAGAGGRATMGGWKRQRMSSCAAGEW
jgi:hypothetical protein